MAREAGEAGADARLKRWEALLAAARAVLAERGLEAATVAEIVARAGVAQGTFYLYFPSKLAVVFALTGEMNTAVLVAFGRALTLAGSLGEGIDRAVAEAFRVMESYRDVLGIVRSRAGVAGMSAEWRALDEPFEEVMAGLIQGAQAAGQTPASVNAVVAARLIRGLIEHAGYACFVEGAGEQEGAFIAEVARVMRAMLGVAPGR